MAAQSLMYIVLIVASLGLIGNIVFYILLTRLTRSLMDVSHAMQIKAVKLDIIENMLSVGIYVADEKGSWTYVNNTIALMLGMQPAEMIGNGWLRNIVKREEIYSKWIGSIENKLPYSDVITVKLGQRTTQFELNTLPVLTDGRYQAYVGTIKPLLPIQHSS